MSHEFSVSTLTDLAQQLNLVNLQLVADNCGREEIERASEVVLTLRSQIHRLREKLLDEIQSLAQAKATCQQLLASVGQPAKATPGPKASTRAIPSVIPNLDEVNDDEFSTVPKYMKGRLTREKVNLGVGFFNKTLIEKYTLLRQNPAKLSVETRQRFYDLKDLENDETAGRFFITEQDMKTFLANLKGATPFKLDSAGRAILAILRHLGRIKEVRSTGVVRFTVIS